MAAQKHQHQLIVNGCLGRIFVALGWKLGRQRVGAPLASLCVDPTDVPWGVQATFDDLYGNHMVLLEVVHAQADDPTPRR
jgi:hypothetical protein